MLSEEARLTHSEETLHKVFQALRTAGLEEQRAQDCILRMQNAGILFREVADNPFDFSSLTLDEAVGQALGAASVSWNPRPEGEFDSTRCGLIYDALSNRIRQAGPIYG